MRQFFFVVIIMILSTNAATAGIVDTTKDTIDAVKAAKEVADFVYDLVTQKCWDEDWKVADDEGEPVKNWDSSTRIHAWVNITGFRNESMINGTRYVNGSAKDFAIVKRGAKYTLKDEEKFTSLISTLIVSDKIPVNGTNVTIAIQKSTLKYKAKKKLFGIYKWIPKTETHTVSETVCSPKNFTTRISNVTALVTFYNRTISPVTHVYVPNENHSSMKDVLIVRYRYNGSNVTRYDQVGWVMKNSLGAEFVEFVDAGMYPTWVTDENQSVINHCGQIVTVSDPKFNISLLNVSLHTPYETRYISDYSLVVVDDTVILHVPIIKSLILVIASVFTLITIWRRVL